MVDALVLREHLEELNEVFTFSLASSLTVYDAGVHRRKDCEDRL